MSWPTPQDYNEAIQNPKVCFADAELNEGRVETNQLGLPRSMTGAFASVYKIVCPESTWAVRCFLTNRADLKERYLKISDFVLFDDLDCTVDFYYLDKGIKVKGTWYPVLKMKWVEGTNLDQYLCKNFNDSTSVRRLIDQFYHMAMELEGAGIAHGDLQHGNIMVTDSGMRLVDYDALYVPALSGKTSLEVGHPNYQHPQRSEFHYDTTVDHFSMWLIHLSLLAVAIDPALFEDMGGGDECILLRRSDLTNPECSPRFKRLLEHPSAELQQAAALVLRMLWVTPEVIPPLNATSDELNSLPAVKVAEPEGESVGKEPVTLSKTSISEANQSSFPENETGELLLPSSTNRYESLSGNQLNYKRKKEEWRGFRRLKEKLSSQSQAITKRILSGVSPAVWHTYISSQGDSLFKTGEYEQAIKAYAEAYSVYEHSPEEFASTVLEDLFRLGRSFALTNNMSLANNYFLTASRLAARVKDVCETTRADFLLAVCKGLGGDESEALEKLSTIAQLRTYLGYIIKCEMPGRLICHPSVFRLLARLGDRYFQDGFNEAGLNFHYAALEIFNVIYQGAPAQVVSEGARIMTGVGLIHCLERGSRTEAETHFGQAAQLLEPFPDCNVQLLSISFLLLSVQVANSTKGQTDWFDHRIKAYSAEEIEAAWQNMPPGKIDSKVADVLVSTANLLKTSGDITLAKTLVSIAWRLLLTDANFSPYKQITWLEAYDDATITHCLKSSLMNDASKFKSYRSALIDELARKSNSKAALAYAGLLTELSRASSTGGGRNSSNRNLYTQKLENLARSMLINSTTERIVETVSYCSQKNYDVLIDAIVEGYAHSNRIDTLISIACKLADNAQDELEEGSPQQLTSFDHLLASLMASNSKRTIEKTIAGLVRNEKGKVLIGSTMRLSATNQDIVAAVVAEFARQNDDWSLDQIVNSLVENNSLDALEHASSELAMRWKTNTLLSIATKLARKNRFDAFDRVVSAVLSTDRSRSVVLLALSLAESECDQGFTRLLDLIPEKNIHRYFTKIALELAEHSPKMALQIVLDRIIASGDSHSISDAMQCLIKFQRNDLLSCVAGKLLEKGQSEIVQREIIYSGERNAEAAACLAYEMVAAERETSNGQLQIVNKLLKQNNLRALSWLIYLLATNQKNDWLESVASSIANHRHLSESKGVVDGQSGRAFLERALILASEMKEASLTKELWNERMEPTKPRAF